MKHIPFPLLLLVLSLPLFAQNNEIAVSYGLTNYAQSSETPAYGVSYNRFWTRYVSTRVGVLDSRDELPDDQGERSVTAAHASVEYHPFRGRLVSPRVSAGSAYVRSEHTAEAVDNDSTITVAAGGGVDFNLTRRFALGAEVLYIPFTPKARDRFSSKLDPTTFFASARFRW